MSSFDRYIFFVLNETSKQFKQIKCLDIKNNMWLFKRKSKEDKLNDLYQKKLAEAYKMSTINRTESDRLTKEAEEILNQIKELKG